MATLDSLMKLQEHSHETIKRGKVNFLKSPKERLTISYIEIRLDNLEEVWKKFCDTHSQIICNFEKKDYSETQYFSLSTYELVEDLYFEYKCCLKDKLALVKNKSDTIHRSKDIQETVQNPNSIKLPKIVIPNFSGKYLEWPTFHDLFETLIHNNNSLANVQKLHYLKGHLTDEAEQLVRHIPITDANYENCWQLLKRRYNNKRYISNCILNRLVGQKQLTNESSQCIKQLLDTTSECLSALANIGVKVKSWDVLIIHLIANKLDSESRKQWESKASENNDIDELPTLNQFKEFLEHKFRSLEFIEPKLKPKFNVSSGKSVVHIASTSVTDVCPFCKGDHKIIHCKQFVAEDYDSRYNFVHTNKLCFNCLGINHPVFSCRLASRCRICKRKHHSLLHPKSPIKSAESGDKVVASASTTEEVNESDEVVACFSSSNSQVLLATALVRIESTRADAHYTLRCLVDQGAQTSFITESAVQVLGLQKYPSKISVSGVGCQDVSLRSNASVSLKLRSIHDPDFVITVKAHVLKKLTSFLPAKRVVQVWPNIAGLKLADPEFSSPGKVDLLLGAEVFCNIIEEGLVKGPPGYPIAQKTKLGWILSGQINDVNKSLPHNIIALHTHVSEENMLLRKFWELEAEPITGKRILTEDEQRCEDIFAATTTRDPEGRYIVKLPFREDDPKCKYGETFQIARKRFEMLEKRFNNNLQYKEEYSKVINEYVTLNHMELVSRDLMNKKNVVYLPHHGVVRDDKITTKLRVVFDGSCAGIHGISLNDDLLVGPTLQLDLRHIIMRWRRYRVSLVADIVKMYRQIKVTDEDADYQRLLWRDEVGKLQHYRMLRVMFGTSSAPYLAVRVLQQLAHDERPGYELAADRVLSDFYIDDFMSGCDTQEEGWRIYKELNEMMNKGGFQLQKWTSNCKEFLIGIGKATEKEEKKDIGFEEKLQKVLGLTWDNKTDEFEYSLQMLPLHMPVTKRKVISDISRLFDPLGWISPVIISAKIFIQKLWISGIGWDEEVPTELLQEWLNYRLELSQVICFRIPRWIYFSRENAQVELHGFSDASCDAYAAVIYSRVIDMDGHVHVSLITSKTKVAPIKQVSIPRLELCGAHLLSKLLHEVSETLEVSLDFIHAWTDSSVVLAWLSSHPSRWKTFVANRVSEILQVVDRSRWSHVKSRDNPADCASRGVNPAEFVALKLWKDGPLWLLDQKINYSPLPANNQSLSETQAELRPIKLFHAAVAENEHEMFGKFSSMRKLIRVLAFCRRFHMLTHVKPKPKFPNWLTCSELQEARKFCIIECQRHHFNKDLDDLLRNGTVSKRSKLIHFNPFVDCNGVLRVGGRLQRASMSEDMKHPILLPHSSRLTELIVSEAHDKTFHGGPQLMINYIRTKYWILKVKNLAKYHVRRCVRCIRYAGRAQQPIMGNLPECRTSATRAFLHSGVDYAGPFAIRTTKGRGHRATKGYISLFICMSTKAIHLEAVSDMTAEGFLAAFRRFVARRGHCAHLWSDNGTNFIGAQRELKALLIDEKSLVAADIAESLANNGTEWHRIPPYSPNFGGLWEAGVKSTKHHLRRVIGDATLTFEEFSTLLTQIEACLNSRPISQISDSVEDAFPLTPGHFLVGEPLLLVPDSNYEKSNVSSLKRWQLTQKMVQHFWRRWSREYLTLFFQRHKWNRQCPEPQIGDIVLVMEDELPPSKWLYGIIVDKHPGVDGITRVVSLRCKNVIIKRLVSKLCLLPPTE